MTSAAKSDDDPQPNFDDILVREIVLFVRTMRVHEHEVERIPKP